MIGPETTSYQVLVAGGVPYMGDSLFAADVTAWVWSIFKGHATVATFKPNQPPQTVHEWTNGSRTFPP